MSVNKWKLRLPSLQGGGDGRHSKAILEELIGIIAGDGCLASDGETIKIDINSKEDLLKQRIIQLFKLFFDKEVKVRRNKGNWITLTVYSKKIHNFLTSYLPIGKKAGKLSMVPITPHSLRGIFLTDGYLEWGRRKEVCIVSKDYNFLENISKFLASHSINSKIYTRKSGFKKPTTTFALRIFRSEDIIKFLSLIDVAFEWP